MRKEFDYKELLFEKLKADEILLFNLKAVSWWIG